MLLNCIGTNAQDVKITYKGNKADVTISNKDSIKALVDGANVQINSKFKAHELKVLMSGKSDAGRLVLKTDAKAKIQLNNLDLTSQEGAAIWLKNKKRVEIEAFEGTKNNLTVTACVDTATNKQAVIWSKDKVHFSGKGELYLLASGDGCKGINAKDNIKIDDLTLSVITEGNNLGKDNRGFGGGGAPGFGGGPGGQGGPDFGGGFPGGGQGFPGGGPGGLDGQGGPDMNRGQGNDGQSGPGMRGQRRSGDRPDRGQGFQNGNQDSQDGSQNFGGGFPGDGQGFPGDGQGFPGGGPGFGGQGFHGGGMPDFGGGFPGGGGMPGGAPGNMASGDSEQESVGEFKQKYISTTKGIKSQGTITINSGNVYCKTSSAGAEGIEGKEGVTINGGTVTIDAIDDAINSGGQIIFNGGKTIAESHSNDAVDSNLGGFGFPGGGGFGAPGGGFGGGMPGGGPGFQNGQGFPGGGSGNGPDFGQGFPGGGPGFGGGNSNNKQTAAIVIAGGEVYPWSHVGVPEEGLDCDNSAIEVSGGKLFSIGAGMGEMPSTPTQQSSTQPSVLFIGLNITKGEKIEILDGNKVIYTVTPTFSFNSSASLVTCPELQKGQTYTLRTKNLERTFTLSDNFTIVRR